MTNFENLTALMLCFICFMLAMLIMEINALGKRLNKMGNKTDSYLEEIKKTVNRTFNLSKPE